MKKALFALLLVSALLSAAPPTHQSIDELLAAAYSDYVVGETAVAATDRQAAFNRALTAYSSLEEHHPVPQLQYNIGNCYFQLGQYPWAILYYERALTGLPRETKLYDNLILAQQRAGVRIEHPSSLEALLIYPHAATSVAERRLFLLWCTIAAVLVGSLMIWRPSLLLRRLNYLAALLMTTTLLSLGYSEVLSTPKAVIVTATPLYKDAGEQYATVGEGWVVAGSNVEVLQFVKEHTWAEIRDADGLVGFIPQDRLRLI